MDQGKKGNTFQTIVLVIFIGALVIGVLLFAGVIPGFHKSAGDVGNIVLWGTMPADLLKNTIDQVNSAHRNDFFIDYVAKDPRTYESDLIEALAAGKGPDLFVMTQDMIVRNSDKVVAIPSATLPERTFKDTFIGEGELFLAPEGAIGVPLAVDPLIMYWNRDLFARNGFAKPPVYWDELLNLADKLTVRDQNKNIVTSAVALGEFANVLHAKSILTALFLQAGDPLVSRTQEGYAVVFGRRNETNQSPSESVARFYTEFSDAAKTTYAWNRALPSSLDMFTRGDLAIYFGFASERAEIVAKNPHLNFDVAILPQIRGSKANGTYGHVYALAIARNSGNTGGALLALSTLVGGDVAGDIAKVLSLVPARRDLLTTTKEDAFDAVTHQSALIAQGWLDPNAAQTYTILKDMIENISSGRLAISIAVSSAADQLETLIR